MTREEAIKQIESLFEHCKVMITSDEPVWSQDCEALKVALFALRGPTREQVEKAWRGEWNDINPKVLKPNVSWICRCTKCGCPQDYKHNFCPNCGAAQTDNAVEMVIERLEALYEET